MSAPPLTPEEIAEAEKAAQEQDLLDAQAEEDASNVKMAALEGVFVPSGITRHRGVGPLKIESPRGLISAFSGDLICKLHWPKNPEALPEEWDVVEERIVVSETILAGLLFTCTIPEFPDLLEFRAARIGEERRKAAAEVPPVALAAGFSLGRSSKNPIAPKPTPLPAPKLDSPKSKG